MTTRKRRGGAVRTANDVLSNTIGLFVLEDGFSAVFRAIISRYADEYRALMHELKTRAKILLGIRKKPRAEDTRTVALIAAANEISVAKITNLTEKCRTACEEESLRIASDVIRASPSPEVLAASVANILETARELGELTVSKEVRELEAEIARSVEQLNSLATPTPTPESKESGANRTRRARVPRANQIREHDKMAIDPSAVLSGIIDQSARKIRRLRRIQKNIEERGRRGLESIISPHRSTRSVGSVKGGGGGGYRAISSHETRRRIPSVMQVASSIVTSNTFRYVAWVSSTMLILWLADYIGSDVSAFYGKTDGSSGQDLNTAKNAADEANRAYAAKTAEDQQVVDNFKPVEQSFNYYDLLGTEINDTRTESTDESNVSTLADELQQALAKLQNDKDTASANKITIDNVTSNLLPKDSFSDWLKEVFEFGTGDAYVVQQDEANVKTLVSQLGNARVELDTARHNLAENEQKMHFYEDAHKASDDAKADMTYQDRKHKETISDIDEHLRKDAVTAGIVAKQATKRADELERYARSLERTASNNDAAQTEKARAILDAVDARKAAAVAVGSVPLAWNSVEDFKRYQGEWSSFADEM